MRTSASEWLAAGKAARWFRDLTWSTLDSWNRKRRVIGKGEWSGGEANPRLVATLFKRAEAAARPLYKTIYCARSGDGDRIKERHLELFADRTSAASVRANQLHLWFGSANGVRGE